jgi:hypothetical protein
MKWFFTRVIFAIVFINSVDLFSQIANSQIIFGGNSFDYGIDLVQTSDSGYLVLGSSGSYSTSNDIILWHVDKDLEYQWHRILGTNDADNAVKLCPMGVDTFLVLCSTLHPGTGNYNLWTFVVLPNGDTINSHVFDHSVWEFPSCVLKSTDGGFLMSGTTYDSDDSEADVFFLKVDQNFSEVWYNRILRPGKDSVASILEFNSKYYVVGTSLSPFGNQSDISFLKLNSTGFVELENYFGGSNDDVGADIVKFDDGNLLIGGQSKSFGSFPTFFNSYLLKIDTNGVFVWPQAQSSNDALNYRMKRILLDQDQNIFAFFSRKGAVESDYHLFKNNAGGFYIGSAGYGTFGNEYLGNAILTSDKGVALIGTTSDYAFGLENFYFVKADSLLTNTISPSIEVGIYDETKAEKTFDLFPSIARDWVTVKFPFHTTPTVFQVYNSIGALVLEKRISCNDNSPTCDFIFQVDDFPPGIYFAKIYVNAGAYQSIQKFVVLDK